MVRTTALALAILMSASIAHADSKQEQKIQAMLARPPADLERLIKVSGDSLDPEVTVSTQNVSAITYKGLLASNTEENSFLRIFIDRKTGEVTAQIYHVAIYGGSGWQFYRSATFETLEGVSEVPTIDLGTDVSCYRYGCTHYEDVAVPIPFSLLEQAAAKFDPANPTAALKYRLFGKGGGRIDDGVPINEIVAAVNVVNRLRQKSAIIAK